jgi:NitT/TauT family transport system ATP-binding protein
MSVASPPRNRSAPEAVGALAGGTASRGVPEITLSGVSMRFQTSAGAITAVERTDLVIPGGELLVLLGPSGCGKTTLLRMIAGLVRPTTGTVRIGNRELWTGDQRDAEALQELGVVFQEAHLFPWYSIEHNVSLPLRLRGVPKPQRLAKARELCRLVGIGGFEGAWPRQLSGGMRQRAAIARALSCEPHILLMDEPFGALDAITRDQLNLELQRIWLAKRCTVLFVTHSIAEAVFLADRIVLLSPRPGRVDTVINVPFSRPRAMSVQDDPAFQSIVRGLRQRLEAMT